MSHLDLASSPPTTPPPSPAPPSSSPASMHAGDAQAPVADVLPAQTADAPPDGPAPAGGASSTPGPADSQRASPPPPVSWPTAPQYIFSAPAPRRIAARDAADLQDAQVDSCFFRSARWAADMVSVLTTAEDRVLRVFHTEFDEDGRPTGFAPPRAFPQPDAVNGAAWYPSASAGAPETYCLVASVKDTPVRLIDAADGRIRATYPIVDHQERFVAPHSMAFDPTGAKLYCGFDSAIEVFDIASPGYGTAERIKTVPSRKARGGGQRGLISALAFSPHGDSTFAAGSFTSPGSISLYDTDTHTPAAALAGVRGGGVTQLAFHPLHPHILFAASRRSDGVQVWDTRDTSTPLAQLDRPAGTNQRLAFDVDPWGRWLASGDEHGIVRVWDIAGGTFEPVMETRLADDAVNSVQFNAYQPLLLTSAGSRIISDDPPSDSDSDSSDSEMDADSDSDSASGLNGDGGSHVPKAAPARACAHLRPYVAKDTRLSLWDMSGGV